MSAADLRPRGGVGPVPPAVTRPLAAGWRGWNNARPFIAPPRCEWPVAVRWARIAGYALLVAELVGFAWWSVVLVNHYALTSDFSAYNQATYLIAHGHLDPYSSSFRFPFWQNDGEFIFWPLAAIERIWPHLVTLKWLQDIAVVSAEAIAFGWICEIAAVRAAETGTVRLPVALVGLGALMLISDPWLVWTVSFDAHPEAFGAPFLIAAARDVYRGRRTTWLWAIATIGCGAVSASYLAALGGALMLSGRRWGRVGLAFVVLGAGWTLALHALGSGLGSGVSGLYGPLIAGPGGAIPADASTGTLIRAFFSHPGRFVDTMWRSRVDLWATVSPIGALGLVWIPALVPGILILAEGGLNLGFNFSFPSFQNCSLVAFVAVGTIELCSLWARRGGHVARWAMPLLIVLLAVNAVAWSVVWLPQTEHRWLRVSPGAARILAGINARIGPGDEVVASQGIAGGFSERQWLHPVVSSDLAFGVRAPRVWVIFAPDVGIETASVSGIRADVSQLAARPGARLVTARDGIWAFEWSPRRGARTLTLGGAGASQAVNPVCRGPVTHWHLTSDGHQGYVLDKAFWREPPGTYSATVSLDVTSAADVEVWDDTTSRLLARRTVPDTEGPTTEQLTVPVSRLGKQHPFEGWGLWRAVPQAPATGDVLEVRVWTPGGADHVSVYAVSLRRD
jgi:hypothetical protein